jgi:predicted metal-dependent phosphoesterase TrpH
MRTRPQPLLCELHAHTRWSDGALTVRELCDLYGRNGFDVLAITDHVVRRDDPWRLLGNEPQEVAARDHPSYLAEIAREARRARALYDLLVLPGLELTYNDDDERSAAHAVAVGLRRHVAVDDGLEPALAAARGQGAALIAAHPYALDAAAASIRRTGRFAAEWRELAPLVDRFELFNRCELFGWVAEAGLPTVACGDFHRSEHLPGWKTLLPCAKREEAVVAYLRSARPAYLVRLDAPLATPLAA